MKSIVSELNSIWSNIKSSLSILQSFNIVALQIAIQSFDYDFLNDKRTSKIETLHIVHIFWDVNYRSRQSCESKVIKALVAPWISGARSFSRSLPKKGARSTLRSFQNKRNPLIPRSSLKERPLLLPLLFPYRGNFMYRNSLIWHVTISL